MKCLSLALLLTLAAAAALADDAETFDRNWPAWRGPRFDGTAPHADPPLTWGPEKNIKWKSPIPGEGSGTPIVWEDRVFVTAAVQTDRLAERRLAADETAKTEPPEQTTSSDACPLKMNERTL